MKNVELSEERIQLFRPVINDPENLLNVHDGVISRIDEVKEDIRFRWIVFVDLEGVDVDDGLGDVGESPAKVVDPFADSRRSVTHHEANSLCETKNIQRLF
jgi:hypothetical protein